MEKHRAIPQGYMTVGQVAKKMNTTVRTLQYYDKEGIFSPSGISEGGLRLYTNKDIVKLHQILSMKYLGFSLDDIKNQLVALDTPEQVSDALTKQALNIREKISSLKEILEAIETLNAETIKMRTVDWTAYATIVALLQRGSEDFWLIKHMDNNLFGHAIARYDEKSGFAMMGRFKDICTKLAELKNSGTPPDSPEGQAAAKDFWDFVTEFTGGDVSLLTDLIKFNETKTGTDEQWDELWGSVEGFISEALSAYFTNIGHDPFKEEEG